MITIHEITAADIDKLLPLGELFYKETGLPGTFQQDLFAIALTELVLFGSGRGWCTEDHTGLITGVATTDTATGDLIVNEWIWFVHPDHRGRGVAQHLFDCLETWAQSIHASRLYTGAVSSARGSALSQLYLRRGYREIERRFLKELK